MIASLTAWAYGLLTVALLLILFTTTSVAVLCVTFIACVASLVRGLYWRDVAIRQVLRA